VGLSPSNVLHNSGNGLYKSDSLNLGNDQLYRLRIKVIDTEYLSDFTAPIQTPVLDSVVWRRSDDDRIIIYASTHDPLNKTFFYKFDYEEVWEVRAAFSSRWDYENGQPRARTTTEIKRLLYCWQYNSNSDFITASTVRLTEDALTSFPITSFEVGGSPRLGYRYSILVNERAVSQDEFEFIEIIKKNSNSLGTFFDAQPSQLIGNIQNLTSDEPVIGFIGAYTTRSQRIFIYHEDISDWNYYPYCSPPIQARMDDPAFNDLMINNEPINAILGDSDDDAPPIVGFTVAPRYCVDCRIRSGSRPKPDFWIAEDGD
jgi:Domain of unknown function (DUF4249)